MKLAAILNRIWTRKALSLANIPDYRATIDAEMDAIKRGDTRAIHRARKERQTLILNALRAASGAGEAA